MRLFSVDGRGRILRTEIEHPDWPLRPAEAELVDNTMAAAHGIALPDTPPHLLMVDRLDVHAWLPARD